MTPTPTQPTGGEQARTEHAPTPTAVLSRDLMCWSVLPLGAGVNQYAFHQVSRESAERLTQLEAALKAHLATIAEQQARIGRLEKALQWNAGAPDVKEGGCETFWCCIEGVNGKHFHRHLDYANRHVMPLADGIDEPPAGVEPVPESDDEYYWTGWHEKSCDSCDTQWMFSQKVVAWMRLPKFAALNPAGGQT